MTRTPVLSTEELTSARPGPPPSEAQAGIPARVADRIRRGDSPRDVLDFLVAELQANYPAHAWTGVYLVEGDALVVGPYRGPDTPHRRIRIGDEGICGWVAREGKPQVIPDVGADPRYLSCSPVIRSEIVVPIARDGAVVGVIDVDSEVPAAFTKTDLDALTELARLVAPILHGPGGRP
ncbi:MAG: GAF domain-containing protein [Hyphomicrobiales bacterium]